VIPALGSGPEFDRIRAIAQALGDRAAGLGDDCALIPFGEEYLAVSTDLSIDGVHFQREWLALEEIGWRAAAAALSDLAAVGAAPIGVLASLALPAESPASEAVALMEGIAWAAHQTGGKVLGGDLARSPTLAIDVTVLGRTTRPVRRSGAGAGDGVWITGRLGESRAALLALTAGREPEPPMTREAFAHPEPRIAAGSWLARQGARAMIDLSDGLAGDASHIAAASGVALVIELETIPLGTGVRAAAYDAGEDPYQFAARGGEDYELLAVLPANFSLEVAARFEREAGVPLTRIGRVQKGEGVELRQGGRRVSLSGFNHFT
jgi:thiamine-monophosphate kinase